MQSEGVHELPVGRHLAVDEQGVGLRATWRLDRGFVNVSLWRDNRCTETFHLTPTAAGQLVNFLVGGLADAASATTESRHLHSVQPPPARSHQLRLDVVRSVAGGRRAAAEILNRMSQRLQR